MKVVRFEENPIIHENLQGLGEERDNINGPSLIKVPSWVENPLGKYYLYFAHHKGQYIKLAYANSLKGPWMIYQGGVLRLEKTPCTTHIASPDVHIDDENEKIIMYYHGKHKTTDYPKNLQLTFLAESKDGLNFETTSSYLGTFYFKVFKYSNKIYAFSKSANNCSYLLKSDSYYGPFIEIKELLPSSRHTAVLNYGGGVKVFYSRIGDKPESIICSNLNMKDFDIVDEEIVLEPERGYEGVNLPLKISDLGMSKEPVRELRDPAIFIEKDRIYLLYANSGEKGICIAELLEL